MTDVIFLDVRQDPFDLYGLYQPKMGLKFRRLSDKEIAQAKDDLWELAYHTAGARVRFSTDSPFIALRCTMDGLTQFAHMTGCGAFGFDLYETVGDRDYYIRSFVPPMVRQDGTYASIVINVDHGYSVVARLRNTGGMRSYTIHFPLYNDVRTLEIGLRKGSKIDHGAPYRPIKPIVYYGPSDLQGCAASRPGNAFTNIISAHRNIDHYNMGFSGSCLGELFLADYFGKMDMSVFVMAFDANVANAAELAGLHAPFFRRFREMQPTVPIILMTLFFSQYISQFDQGDCRNRREVIYRTYKEAIDAGDSNVYFIDGASVFTGTYYDAYTVDGSHPNDAGMIRIAEVLGGKIDEVLRFGQNQRMNYPS